MKRRRGIEPRTPRLQLGRSPLAVAAHGTPGVIRTPNRGFGIRSPHHRQPGHNGAPGWIRTSTVPLLRRLPLPLDYGRVGRLGRIRTDTGHGLSVLPLPSWATSLWCSGRDSNSQRCGPRPHASTVAPPEHWWAVKDSNLGDPKGIPRLQRGAFGLSANCPKRIVKDLAEGRRLERLCPEGPWLSRPVGYQLPEPSGYNLKLDLKGNYRLDERHQDCPTVSRYDRRPRLNKRRI